MPLLLTDSDKAKLAESEYHPPAYGEAGEYPPQQGTPSQQQGYPPQQQGYPPQQQGYPPQYGYQQGYNQPANVAVYVPTITVSYTLSHYDVVRPISSL